MALRQPHSVPSGDSCLNLPMTSIIVLISMSAIRSSEAAESCACLAAMTCVHEK